MKKYDTYKDSGIKWIGKIPSEWRLTRMKFLGDAFGGVTYSPRDITDNTNDALVLRSSNIQNSTLCLKDTVYINAQIPEKKIIRKGDILICSRNGSKRLIGKNICIDERTEGQTFGAFMMVFRSGYWKFLSHFFNSPIFKSQSGLFLTSTINQLTSGTLNNFYIAIPESLEEQTQIAHYLNHKTQQLDSLIAKKERLIALLEEERTAIINQAVTKGLDLSVPMKDSGIDWLGEIPEHWMTTRINRVIKVKDGTHDSPSQLPKSEETFPLITSKDFKNGNIVFENAKNISPEDHEIIYKRSNTERGDILMSMIGGNIGNMVLVDTDKKFSIKNVCLFKTTGRPIIAKHLYYILKSSLLQIQIDLNSRGGAQGFLSLGDLRSLIYFVIPKMEELEVIVKYLDKKNNQIDIAKQNLINEIHYLKEYKSTLISEVVTGKIDVREEILN
ncbi:restriction endonuclease subunit S [uncultured Dokdonia sp.]|uniref:restriction endonuclease subunit S n=1 Tax=uncultured Dokdonia sp. TaxID=575653 RepID=UPI00260433E5|nr:restriction endonuclease subunit S [uncultured Dokdonia sp.]